MQELYHARWYDSCRARERLPTKKRLDICVLAWYTEYVEVHEYL